MVWRDILDHLPAMSVLSMGLGRKEGWGRGLTKGTEGPRCLLRHVTQVLSSPCWSWSLPQVEEIIPTPPPAMIFYKEHKRTTENIAQ